MKMKKITSLLLVGAMTLGMTSVVSAEEATKIRILWPETDSTQVDVIENYIQPALAEQFPDIEFEYIPANLNQDSPLKTMSAADDLPEIWYTDGGSVDAIVAAGDALDVSSYVIHQVRIHTIHRYSIITKEYLMKMESKFPQTWMNL